MGDVHVRPLSDCSRVEALNLQEAERALGDATRNVHPDDDLAYQKNPRPDPSDGFHTAYVKALYRRIAFLKHGVCYENDRIAHPV